MTELKKDSLLNCSANLFKTAALKYKTKQTPQPWDKFGHPQYPTSSSDRHFDTAFISYPHKQTLINFKNNRMPNTYKSLGLFKMHHFQHMQVKSLLMLDRIQTLSCLYRPSRLFWSNSLSLSAPHTHIYDSTQFNQISKSPNTFWACLIVYLL